MTGHLLDIVWLLYHLSLQFHGHLKASVQAQPAGWFEGTKTSGIDLDEQRRNGGQLYFWLIPYTTSYTWSLSHQMQISFETICPLQVVTRKILGCCLCSSYQWKIPPEGNFWMIQRSHLVTSVSLNGGGCVSILWLEAHTPRTLCN